MNPKTNFVLALCFAALAPAGLKAQSSSLYPINYDETQAITRTDRYTNAITLAGSDGEQTVAVNQLSEGRLYIKRLDDCLMAKAGETVTAGFDASLGWMCGYAYIDLDNNGLFDLTYDANGVTDQNELMAYSMYKDKDSNGNAVSGEPKLNPPSFVIPAGTKPGIYRMRYKIDWDNVDPGGNNGATNKITTNGGVIVDTRINIHGDKAKLALSADTKNGTATLADGTSLDGGAEVDFGKDVRLKLSPEEGYRLSHFSVRHGYNLDGEQYVNGNRQWDEATVRTTVNDDNTCSLQGAVVDGDVLLTPVFAKVDATKGEQGYGLSFDASKKRSATADGTLTAITLAADGQAATTIDVAADGANTVYRNLTTSVVGAKAGQRITATADFSGNSKMNAYLYLDLNQDGRFDTETADDGAVTLNSELVSFSYLNGKNSKGEAQASPSTSMPEFTLPETLTPGCYRARLKLDVDNIAPEGSEAITGNGGYVVDFLLNIHADNGRLEVNGIGGNMVGANNSGVPETVAYNTTLDLMPLAPASGYVVQRVVVRHGHNLDGEQYVNGNRQWDEYETTEAENEETFTVSKANVDGDVRVTAYFTTDGTEEYKLVFADEFNGEDGSMPDSNNWQRCTRENPTWKRFTSQTEEGQRRTAFIRDGKLVTRCIANDIDEEGSVEMISGAIESSDKMYYTYGRIEGRLRTTPHTGNFPAFWLMPQDNSAGWPTAGEIDLWEQIDTENKTYHTVHTHVTYDLHQALPNSGSVYTNSADYHIIAMEWEPDLLTWYVDGQKAFSYAKSTNQSLLDLGQWPYDKPFYVILNQSVGNGTWARPCDVSFEYETLFDYVRLYQKEGQTATLPPTTGIGCVSVSDNTPKARLDVYAAKGGLKLVAPDEQTVTIADVAGRTVYSKRVQGNVDVALPSGLYVVAGKKIIVD